MEADGLEGCLVNSIQRCLTVQTCISDQNGEMDRKPARLEGVEEECEQVAHITPIPPLPPFWLCGGCAWKRWIEKALSGQRGRNPCGEQATTCAGIQLSLISASGISHGCAPPRLGQPAGWQVFSRGILHPPERKGICWAPAGHVGPPHSPGADQWQKAKRWSQGAIRGLVELQAPVIWSLRLDVWVTDVDTFDFPRDRFAVHSSAICLFSHD